MFGFFTALFGGAYYSGKIAKEKIISKQSDQRINLYSQRYNEIKDSYNVADSRDLEINLYLGSYWNVIKTEEKFDKELKFVFENSIYGVSYTDKRKKLLKTLLIAEEGKIDMFTYSGGFYYTPRDPKSVERRMVHIINEIYKKIDPILELAECTKCSPGSKDCVRCTGKCVRPLYLLTHPEDISNYKPFKL